MNRIYACIDLKSFYASVECVERGLNPLTTNLVVADSERTEKTICLAVSPSLKSYGIAGRARLFEVVHRVKKINEERKKNNKGKLSGKTYYNDKIKLNPSLALDFVIAKPRMSLYIKYSSKIYNVYLKHLSKDDIYVYSIDEIFCDITDYLKYRKLSAEEFVTEMVLDVLKTTGITATAGIGTNLYLAKVAMDIVAKHIKPNSFGVRLAYLDEKSYRKLLWNHTPLTDFWRIGKGIAKKLNDYKIYTMGDLARKSLDDEELLYDLFGVNAELIIDHAWGYEPCTIKDIKAYKPKNNSLSRGQVLSKPYDYLSAKLVVIEMMDMLALDLVFYHYVTDMITLDINYDAENLQNNYKGKIDKDYYGRSIPKAAHGIVNLSFKTSSSELLMKEISALYEKIVDTKLTIRRITITVGNLLNEDIEEKYYCQYDLFGDVKEKEERKNSQKAKEEKERKVQKTILDIKNKYGKNALLRGINLVEGSTAKKRNNEIGGHRA